MLLLLLYPITPDTIEEWAQSAAAPNTVGPAVSAAAEEARELARPVGDEVALERLQQFIHYV